MGVFWVVPRQLIKTERERSCPHASRKWNVLKFIVKQKKALVMRAFFMIVDFFVDFYPG